MTALSIALAYIATLAGIGWLLWFRRDNRKDLAMLTDLEVKIVSVGAKATKLDETVKDLASRVRNCELKAGIPTARRTPPSDEGMERVP